MWRVCRAARSAYARRPIQEWRERCLALGNGRGSTPAESTDVPDQSKGRTLSTQSTGSSIEQSRLPFQAASTAGDPSFEFSRIPVREFCGAVCTSGLLGRPHSFRAFSSEVESKSSDEAGAEAEVPADEVSSDEEEGGDNSEDAQPSGKKSSAPVRKKGETATVRMLWSKLSRLPKQKTDGVLPEIKKWKDDGHKLTKGETVSLIRRMKKQARFRQALVLSEWAEKEFPQELNEVSIAGRIELYGKMRQVKNAEATFEAAEKKSPMIQNTMLAVYVSQGNHAKAESFFEAMKQEGHATTAFPFNQMMMLYKRKNQATKVQEVLTDMKSRGVSLDNFTYNILLDMEAKAGKIDKVDELYEQMKADPGVALDAATCGTLAVAYGSADNSEKAEEFIKMLGHVPFPNKQPTFEILIRSFASMGKVDYIEKVWAIIKRQPRVPIQSYVCMIESYGRLGLREKAEETFAEMEKERGLQVPSQFNALLGVYTSSSETMDKAEEVLAKMDAHPTINRNALTFHKLVSSHLRDGNFDKAVEVMGATNTSTKRSRAVPWHDTLLLMLQGYAVKGDILNAEKQFQEMKKVYRRASLKTYNALLTAYVTARERPGGFSERMAADSVEPDDETRSLLEKLKQVTDSSEDVQAAASE